LTRGGFTSTTTAGGKGVAVGVGGEGVSVGIVVGVLVGEGMGRLAMGVLVTMVGVAVQARRAATAMEMRAAARYLLNTCLPPYKFAKMFKVHQS